MSTYGSVTWKVFCFGCARQVMITGDQALTACHVAAQVHIVTRPVLILTQRSADSEGQFDWLSPDEKVKIPYKYECFLFYYLFWLKLLLSTIWIPASLSNWPVANCKFCNDGEFGLCYSKDEVLEVAETHDFCVAGDGLGMLQRTNALQLVVPLTQVSAF